MGASASRATARLLISCPDGPGIVAAVSAFLFAQGANIVTSDQHSTDPSGGRFFTRMEFTLDLDDAGWAALEREFARVVAEPRAMEWRLARVSGPRRLAVLASREDHCLLDILWRASRGELDAQVAVVISNHATARRAVEAFGVPFRHVPVVPETKPASEAAIANAVAEAYIEDQRAKNTAAEFVQRGPSARYAHVHAASRRNHPSHHGDSRALSRVA